MRTQLISVALLLTFAGLVTACGQKGPLYLPQDPARPATSAPVAQPQGSTNPTQAGQEQREQDESEQKTDQQLQQYTEAEAVTK
ncbi:lipoprotein [Microbulbifer sp. ALW1]|uniref:LPS translocon maturation chaperone LptM n=1 Tax=Microbulbifer sp. (strain ALW1) TaxID=1516059 RepID=UPI00135A8A35|nr:lipoprotein [Microbulbifer sp. ALW1]